ncbi:MAG: M23 family metallopeptidase [Chloroflexota bacterium]
MFATVYVAAQQPVDNAIAVALTAYNARPQLAYTYRVAGRHPETITEAGAVYLELVNVDTGKPVEGLIEVAPVTLENGLWQVTLPGRPGYYDALLALPDSIRLRIDTAPYRPAADPALIPETAYGLPYPHGDFGTITRSFNAHGRGTIDFDLTGRDVAAMKDGTVIYADDSHTISGTWWYWNLVIIQHGEHEYTLYGHLAPDSISDEIKAGCVDFRCDVPVNRGDVIGAEGNTGRSTNPHLHVEFGQQVGYVSYPDLADEDRDGNRIEQVQTAFVHAEQNVSIAGYTRENVALWDYGRLEQAAHTPAIPAENVIRNGDFALGTDAWTPIGQLNWSVDSGVLRATRLRTTAPPDYAAFYQNVGYSAYADQPLDVTLKLGNASNLAKTATVEIMNAAGRQYGAITCHFSIAPGAPLATYAVRGVPGSTWADVRVQISVNPADGAPALLVDGVTLKATLRQPDAEYAALD